MRRLEEAEGSRGQADLLKLQELEVGMVAWIFLLSVLKGWCT